MTKPAGLDGVPPSSHIVALTHHAAAGGGAVAHQVVATHAAVNGSTGAQSVSASSLLIQMVVGLIVIVILIKLASKFVQGRGGRSLGHSPRSSGVSVVGRQSLGKGVQVAMVAAGRQTFLLGVTQRQVTLLGEVDTGQPAPVEDHEPTSGSLQLVGGGHRSALAAPGTLPGWKSAIEQMRVRTARRA
jgi:flagellar biogenesis protein FliO